MSEYADGFDDGKGEKFDELMVEIVNLRLDFQNCEAKRVGAINSLREHINICNGLKIENAALREQLKQVEAGYATRNDEVTGLLGMNAELREQLAAAESRQQEAVAEAYRDAAEKLRDEIAELLKEEGK